MILSANHRDKGDLYPKLHSEATGELGWQVGLTNNGSMYAYVTADEADRLADAWAEVAFQIRDREAKVNESEPA